MFLIMLSRVKQKLMDVLINGWCSNNKYLTCIFLFLRIKCKTNLITLSIIVVYPPRKWPENQNKHVKVNNAKPAGHLTGVATHRLTPSLLLLLIMVWLDGNLMLESSIENTRIATIQSRLLLPRQLNGLKVNGIQSDGV